MKIKSVILYRLFFLIICGLGIYLSILENSRDAFTGNGTAINFYTQQSNIWVFLLETYLLIITIIKHIKGKSIEGEKTIIFKYMVTVAISLTFIVYWGMLAPYLKDSYVFSFSNIVIHTITPLLMVIDYLLFDRQIKISKKCILLSIIPPLYYFIFAMIRAEVSDTLLTAGSRYPYWFMDLDLFGWFGNVNGLGVLYWIVLLIFFVLGLGGVLYKIRTKIKI